MWGIIALIAIYLIIKSGKIYIQRRDFLASFECLKILHTHTHTHTHTHIYIYIYIYETPVKKKLKINKNIRYILEEIYNSKKDNIFMVNTTQKYYKNKGKIFTLYVNINC